MANKTSKTNLLSCFATDETLSIHEVQERLPKTIAERTLRRWLTEAVAQGQLIKVGQKRGTRYGRAEPRQVTPLFLGQLSVENQQRVLKQLRDLWTHTSTAIEGNTLTLGDTHFILEEGLTVSGKPLKDHQEALGHAAAIELMYQALGKPITEQLCLALHKSIQTEIVQDIYKPHGKWKVTPNGTYTVGIDNQPIYLEYAKPQHVSKLIKALLAELNSDHMSQLTQNNAHIAYAKIHAAIAHIHPFWDGNGRIARLLANVPLLKSGLPPIVIPKELRRDYIQLLSQYELAAGELSPLTGPWPSLKLLSSFEAFCADCYEDTRKILRVGLTSDL